ncbi:histidine kinase [Arthrobacter bambusae]|uniref:Two-component system LytT family sensor kinase n=1 Tax=Arthrobacter bambusae TaxID=1338426 RepID=A0AAW8DDD2_9MICC|nr:histidine kinase [Arthrobacter bambusae]MDP9906352.1 two-component system LytT family sensor kinase [Arthrobacter bambusae]MDQ0129065.1 two-component system LytT family sensor kinase [Arthrobacter bambusae]MDQ0180589.1 two-component system LytT family sensor kinase [Arthrobacter bambusae]
MPDSPLVTAAAIAVIVLAVAIVVGVGLKVIRSFRELGTDAERATYQTLHAASRAGQHLRTGLHAAGAAKASKQLRSLLGCDALAITDTESVLAWDGAAEELKASLMELASGVLSDGRTVVVPASHELNAVVAPIRAGNRVVGAVAAFAPQTGAGLVRATSELADWVAVQVELAELDASRTLLMEAEVRALRAQISPHFIYNSLNAIASFINTDPARARELVVEFADFTRYSFRRHGDFTTLAEELRSIDRYLLLEKARFGDRVQVSLRIAPEVLSTVIPFLSLQPLVENAVRHGLEAKEGPGHITICANDSGAFAEVTIEDDGVGIDPEHLRSVLAGHSDGEHVGLRNVDARLRQVYGDEHGLVIETAPGEGTLITIRVPKSQPSHDA